MKTALSLFCVTAFCFASPARADESLSSAAESSVPNVQLQKELAVLQTDPDQASEACVSAMKDLHDTQGKIADAEERSSSPDLTVAHDVLESNYESAIEMCGPDARRICGSDKLSAKQTHACQVLSNTPD